jgi:hypothetical protein
MTADEAGRAGHKDGEAMLVHAPAGVSVAAHTSALMRPSVSKSISFGPSRITRQPQSVAPQEFFQVGGEPGGAVLAAGHVETPAKN